MQQSLARVEADLVVEDWVQGHETTIAMKKALVSFAAGYGFVSFRDPATGAKALREMDGKYVGNRPCKLRKSSWEV